MANGEPQLGGHRGSEPSLSSTHSRNFDDVIEVAKAKLREGVYAGWNLGDLYWRMHSRELDWMKSIAGEMSITVSTNYNGRSYLVGQPIETDDQMDIGRMYLNAISNKFFTDVVYLDLPLRR